MISKYKEVDTANYRKSPEVQTILEQVQQFVKENMQVTHADSKTFISPHLIDLAPDGFISKFPFCAVFLLAEYSLVVFPLPV